MPGGRNHHLLSDCKGQWRPGYVWAKYYQEGWGANMGYPGVRLDKKEEKVHGYIFTSYDLEKKWKVLDAFEGSDYKRSLVTVSVEGEGEIVSYIYALSNP